MSREAILPVLYALLLSLPVLLLATLVCAALGILRTEARRKRMLLGAGVAFVALLASCGGYYALLFGVYFPAGRPDPANRPGTLTTLGQQAPHVSIAPLDGPAIRLQDLRGRVVLLNFFATWCGPCQMELPHLQTIWDKFHEHAAFRMIVIGREESAETVRAFKDEHGFSFPMACDPDRAAFGRFATESIPRTYLISRDGSIIYQCTGYNEGELQRLRNLIASELAERD